MVIAVIGAQWGDEGKGKIVDLLAERFDIVVRYQGGTTPATQCKSATIRSCFTCCRPASCIEGKTCVLGNGMVIDPKAFFEEADRLCAQAFTSRLSELRSVRAHT
jgi:adenylosuccinate synthase